jgi:sugar phosphate isomerase/epimerase
VDEGYRTSFSCDPAERLSGAEAANSRRDVLAMLASVAAVGAAVPARSQTLAESPAQSARSSVPSMPNLALVSRHLQWTDAENGIRIAQQAGFGAVLWTVRRGAHVTPAQVTTELPQIVEMTRAAGLRVPMVITNIGDVNSDGAGAILATLQRLDIPLYRAAAPRYRYDAPFQPQYDDFRRKLEALSRLNERFGTTAAFHTHAYADTIGGSAWDLWMLMRDLDPRRVGLNYDIGHVMAKGGHGWRESIRAVGPYLHSCSIKDFYWEKHAAVPAGQWPWRTKLVRPGDGMVNFGDFFRHLHAIGFEGPLEQYFEYDVSIPGRATPFDMLGTDYKAWNLDIPEAQYIEYLKRDVRFYKDTWRDTLAVPPPPQFSVKAGSTS